MSRDPANDVEHRPWPLPRIPWVLAQAWNDLLFAHWPVPPDSLRRLVPDALVLEEFDGAAWIGIVPFLLTGLRPRGLPALPVLSTFPELNVRTYVRVGDKPGVYFFSLDAASRLAVCGARTFFRLPYHHADMAIRTERGRTRYRSRRNRDGAAAFQARYRPTGGVFRAGSGTLDHFLVERYCLYAVLRNGRVLRVDIHHPPWVLQSAEAELEADALARANGIDLPARPPVLHFSKRQDTVNWPPVAVH